MKILVIDIIYMDIERETPCMIIFVIILIEKKLTKYIGLFMPAQFMLCTGYMTRCRRVCLWRTSTSSEQ